MRGPHRRHRTCWRTQSQRRRRPPRHARRRERDGGAGGGVPQRGCSAAESANGRGDVQAGNSRTGQRRSRPQLAAVAQLASGRHRPRHHLPLQARSRLRPRRRCCQQPTSTPWGRPERVVLPRRVRPREHGAASNTRQLKKGRLSSTCAHGLTRHGDRAIRKNTGLARVAWNICKLKDQLILSV